MSELFQETTIKNLNLPNRFVRSATWEGMADDDGSCTMQLIDCVVQLARGGVGLIISGHAYVSKEGQAGARQMGIYEDRLVEGFARMTDAVHKAGGRIILQLAHAGCHASTALSGQEAMGPSVKAAEQGPLNREMTVEDIREVVEAFGQGAARARKAGFDGVQIHAAHGYLLSQFLSPFYNKRQDEYGGSPEKRVKIILEVLRSIRCQVGDDYPVLIKMNSQDFAEGGLTVDEMILAASMLTTAGIDAIELSGGTVFSGPLLPVRKGKIDSPDKEVFYREEARRYKQTVGAPLILVGGIRSFQVAEQLVQDGIADYIALSRPLIREPGLVNRWKSGDTRKSACESDNLCFKPAMQGKGIYCVLDTKDGKDEPVSR